MIAGLRRGAAAAARDAFSGARSLSALSVSPFNVQDGDYCVRRVMRALGGARAVTLRVAQMHAHAGDACDATRGACHALPLRTVPRRSSSAHAPPLAQTFPRRARGLEYELNFSLAADGLTTRGEAYRNAPVRDLLEFAGPRGDVRLTRERALEVTGGPMAVARSALAFATDVHPAATVMDVEEFEGRLESVRVVVGGEW